MHNQQKLLHYLEYFLTNSSLPLTSLIFFIDLINIFSLKPHEFNAKIAIAKFLNLKIYIFEKNSLIFFIFFFIPINFNFFNFAIFAI